MVELILLFLLGAKDINSILILLQAFFLRILLHKKQNEKKPQKPSLLINTKINT
jgi:hypothetical protein